MKSNYELSIKTPCLQNFNSFIKTKNGGFCESCQKEVIDFTKMTTEQISTYFNKHLPENTCGRFKANQLVVAHEKSTKRHRLLSFTSGIGLACLSLLTFGYAKAQNTENLSLENDAENIKELKNKITVKGTVTESGLAMPGVSVVLEGTAIGVQTDFDGYFEFPKKLKKGDVLIFSFIGLKSKKVKIEDKNSATKVELQIDLVHCDMILMGKVAKKEVFKSMKKN